MTIHKKAADRGDGQAAYERTSSRNNTTASQAALDRLPEPVRKRYLEDLQMWGATYGQGRRT